MTYSPGSNREILDSSRNSRQTDASVKGGLTFPSPREDAPSLELVSHSVTRLSIPKNNNNSRRIHPQAEALRFSAQKANAVKAEKRAREYEPFF